jgi:uncharacterized membrane protein YeaQ/YmgE (transglycosylase-associated protein family)
MQLNTLARSVQDPRNPGIRASSENVSGTHSPAGRSLRPRAQLEEYVTVTSIIVAIIVGAIIGALGRLVVPGRQPIPIWLTIVVGIVAAFVGTFIARAVGIPTVTNGIDWLELLVQVVVAAIFVVIASNLYVRSRGNRGSVRR